MSCIFCRRISSKRSTVKRCCSLRHQLLPRVKAFLANILPIRFKTFYPDKFWYLNWFSANDSGGISKSEGWWKIKAESLWFNFQCSLSTFYYLPFFLHFPRFFYARLTVSTTQWLCSIFSVLGLYHVMPRLVSLTLFSV